MQFRAVFGAIGVFVLAAQTPIQQQRPLQADEPSRITVDVTRVDMLFTVTDKKGRFVTNLTKEDFEAIEAKKPRVIQEFAAESDLPLRLGILIDTSNSIRGRFKFEQEAAIEFINNVVRTNQDKAMVVRFDNQPELVADLVTDTEKLSTAIRSLRPGGGTAFYDAIYF